MATAKEEISNNGTPIGSVILPPNRVMPQAGIDKLLASEPQWRDDYRSHALDFPNLIQVKYDIAYALITDGHYNNVPFLLKHFAPKRKDLPDQTQRLATSLQLLALEHGYITPNTQGEITAQDAVLEYIAQNPTLSKLRDVVPIQVMDGVVRARLLDKMTDEEKKRRAGMIVRRALIRPYLGDLLVHRAPREVNLDGLFKLFPESFFRDTDSAIYNLLKEYFTQEALRLFIHKSEEDAFSELRTSAKYEPSSVVKRFKKAILEEFEEVRTVPIPDVFVKTLPGPEGQPFPVPHFRQKYFVYEFSKTKRKLVNGGVGAGKTACAYMAMETVGAEKVTIFGPAVARKTWPDQADKLFDPGKKPKVFAIDSIEKLLDSRIKTAQYVFISTEFLSQAWNNPQLKEKIRGAVIDRGTDGMILDESDDFRNLDANCSKMLMEIVGEIEASYKPKHPFDKMPMMALTATPIASGLDDLDIVMGLLYPDKFSLPKKNGSTKPLFHQAVLNDPRTAHDVLFGEKLIMQWFAKDIFGESMEPPELQRLRVELSPYERVIYQWVKGQQLDGLTKMSYLRMALLDPDVIKDNCRKKGLAPSRIRNRPELIAHLRLLHESWTDWVLGAGKRDPGEFEPFSADWIAKMGGADFLIECFFSGELTGGIDQLASHIGAIRKDWQPQLEPSAKYRVLREFLSRYIESDGNDGYHMNCKIFIASPYRKTGITRNMLESEVSESEMQTNAISLFERMISDWFPGITKDQAISVDGRKTLNARSRISEVFREDGFRYNLVMATTDSVSESMNWAVEDRPETTYIHNVMLILLGYTFGADEIIQLLGRFVRPTGGKSVEAFVLEAVDTFDEGNRDSVYLKQLISDLTFMGAELTPEQRELYDRGATARRIVLAEPQVGQYFLRTIIQNSKGAGEEAVQDELEKKGVDGRTFAEMFARFYFDEGNDEYRLVGNNAELATKILLEDNPEKVADVGAGSCMVARKIARRGVTTIVDNVDINPEILKVAKERHPEIGNIIVEGASDLKSLQTGGYDAVTYNFIYHWTKLMEADGSIPARVNDIERVKAHVQMSRIMKPGAKAVLTFPEGAMNPEVFTAYVRAMESFGQELISEQSGESYAVDINPPRRIGWIMTMRKVGGVNLSRLNPTDLALLYDPKVVVSTYKAPRATEPKVVHLEYSVYNAKKFRIRNPLSGSEQSVESDGISGGVTVVGPVTTNGHVPQIPEIDSRQIDDILQVIEWHVLLPKNRLREWRRAIRFIEEIANLSYKDAEFTLGKIILDGEQIDPSKWDLSEQSIRARLQKLQNEKFPLQYPTGVTEES